MTPSINVRLESVLHGFRDVIIPAINKDEVLAIEQAGLILAQLSMLLHQLPYNNQYNRLCYNDARQTAAELVCQPAGGPQSRQAAAALTSLLTEPGLNPHSSYLALADGIASLTRAVAEDGEPAWRAFVNTTVLAFSSRQNWRERIWFRDAGFDVNATELPDLKNFMLEET